MLRPLIWSQCSLWFNWAFRNSRQIGEMTSRKQPTCRLLAIWRYSLWCHLISKGLNPDFLSAILYQNITRISLLVWVKLKRWCWSWIMKKVNWFSSGGSRISQRRGCQPPRWGYQRIIWSNISWKLHENERIQTQGGAHVPSAPP